MASRALPFSALTDHNLEAREIEGALKVLKLVSRDLFLESTYLGRDGDHERAETATKLGFEYYDVMQDLEKRLRLEGSVG